MPGSAQVQRSGRHGWVPSPCLMLLERANYLLANGVELPREAMISQMSAILFAAFHSREASAANGF